MLSKKQLSLEGELRFASEFIRKGWKIFFPYGEEVPIDFLAFKNGKYIRIQVKTTKSKNGIVTCRMKSSNNWQVKKYKKEEIDFFAIYDAENKKGYLLPIEEFEGKTQVLLRYVNTKNNQQKGVRQAKKYLYFE